MGQRHRPAVRAAWPAKVPIPARYLDVPGAPAADPAALAAVRAAADLQRKSPAVTVMTTASTDDTGSTAQGKAVTGFTATGTAAPARDDNTSMLTYGQGTTPQRSLQLDRGRRVLTQVTGTPKAVPGTTLPPGLAWTSNGRHGRCRT